MDYKYFRNKDYYISESDKTRKQDESSRGKAEQTKTMHKRCPSCATENEFSAIECIKCGQKLYSDKGSTSKEGLSDKDMKLIKSVILIAICLLGLIAFIIIKVSITNKVTDYTMFTDNEVSNAVEDNDLPALMSFIKANITTEWKASLISKASVPLIKSGNTNKDFEELVLSVPTVPEATIKQIAGLYPSVKSDGFSKVKRLIWGYVFNQTNYPKSENCYYLLQTHSYNDISFQIKEELKYTLINSLFKEADIISDLGLKLTASNDSALNSVSKKLKELLSLDGKHNYLGNKPEPPRFEKPEYTGSFYIVAEFVGPYENGGFVVRRGSSYYLVENATDVRFGTTNELGGYVEKTGTTKQLLIGRKERTVEVLRLVSQEAFKDDQEAYMQSYEEARRSYSSKGVDYPKELAEYESNKRRNVEVEARKKTLTSELMLTGETL